MYINTFLMTKRLRSFLAAAVIIASLPLFSTANNGQKKVCVLHNGHRICVAEPAAKAHFREHPSDEDLGPCSSGNSN
jgi:hypothetical protein